MNMNMSRPSMLWLYGLIGAFIIGYYVFGDVNDTPVSSDWTTVEQMVEKGEVEKILIVNRDQAQVFLKKEAIAQYRRDTVDERFRRLPETGVQLLFTIGSVDSFREDLKAAEQQSGQVVPVAYKNETNDWTNVLINLLPWVVIIGAWFFIMRSMSRGAGGGAGGHPPGETLQKRKYQPMNLKQAKELVRGRLSDKRYEHTLNVKKMAVKLAKIYGEDEERAALAALLHDSAKEISKDEMREILRAYPQYAEGGEERPVPVWHGVCAAILARTQWGVTDEAVLSAIACHTVGKPGMTRLDKILYLADMTSPERDWPGVEKLRKLEKKDLDAAMLAALKQTNNFVRSQGQPLDPMSKAAYEDILACSGQNEMEGTAESKGL